MQKQGARSSNCGDARNREAIVAETAGQFHRTAERASKAREKARQVFVKHVSRGDYFVRLAQELKLSWSGCSWGAPQRPARSRRLRWRPVFLLARFVAAAPWAALQLRCRRVSRHLQSSIQFALDPVRMVALLPLSPTRFAPSADKESPSENGGVGRAARSFVREKSSGRNRPRRLQKLEEAYRWRGIGLPPDAREMRRNVPCHKQFLGWW